MPAAEWKFWGKFLAAVLTMFFVALVALIAVEPHCDSPKSDRARLDLFNLQGAIGIAASRDGGSAIPVTLEGLVDAGPIEDLPVDPWGDRYCLVPLDHVVMICTLGSDAAPGGADAAADLCVRQPGPREVKLNPPEAHRCRR